MFVYYINIFTGREINLVSRCAALAPVPPALRPTQIPFRLAHQDSFPVNPYRGDEVSCHRAEKDHCYIKTSEYLRDHAFRFRPDDEQPMHVHFWLANASEGDRGNIKAAEGKNRLLMLAVSLASGRDFIKEIDGERGAELGHPLRISPGDAYRLA